MKVTRRKFLKRSLGAAAACGLARSAAANDTRAESITDTHAYLGHWPHRQLSSDDPPKLVADLRRKGVSQAWAGSFDGLFHKDIASVNQRLADACKRIGGSILIPFGTINPMLPDWEDDIRRCHETFHMPGVRLHPTYHGYTLDDSRFAKLLELAAARGLIVQLVTWMESNQHLLLNPHMPAANIKPLAERISLLPRLKVIVANCSYSSQSESLRALVKNHQVYFDLGRANGAATKQLINMRSPERVMFGSTGPLHSTEESLSQLNGIQVSREVHRQIGSANAAALLALAQKTSAAVLRIPGHEIVSTP
jgi:predicted TIM-barrel fold metal-dependent hydrolase